MTDQVTNILAALDFNEELENEVNERIRKVAHEAAREMAEQITEQLANYFLQTKGLEYVNTHMDNTFTARIQQFKNDSSYINNHSNLIKQFATTATQEHLRNSLRHLIGAQNLY